MSHFAIFCLQNRSSFGKNQLLNAPTLVNQNKNKKSAKIRNLQILNIHCERSEQRGEFVYKMGQVLVNQ